jgi:uncharacterized membrane protein
VSLAEFLAEVYIVLWLFFIYSFAGVILEMIYCWTIEYKGVIESRLGLLYLPFNLLYGTGGVIITLVLVPYFENPLIIFGLGLVVGTVLEYITSLVMEKVFHAVYWDYSKEFLNFQGRICLKYAIFWGLLSVFLLYVLDVFNIAVILNIPALPGIIAVLILVVLTLASITLTLLTYRRVEQKNTYLKAKKAGEDATLPNPWWGRLVDRLVPDVVLVNTFPRMSLITEYQELSGHKRKLIVWNLHLGKPSELRKQAGERAERHAEPAASA